MKLGLLAILGYICIHQGTATEKCRPAGCVGGDCQEIHCEHGNCTPEGKCECLPCWMGQQCDEYRNVFNPEFKRKDYEVVVKPDVEPLSDVVHVEARDGDEYACPSGYSGCSCGQIIYSIESGNLDNHFEIDQDNGIIRTTGDMSIHDGEEYQLLVAARNAPNPEANDMSERKSMTYAAVQITVGEDLAKPRRPYYNDLPNFNENLYDSSYDPHKPHHRAKRSVSPPDNVTFYLSKTGDYENVTTMYVGSKIHFLLKIHFPSGTTDMLVELFTPDNDTTVMVVCKPQITHVGANFPTFDKDTIIPQMEAKTSDSTDYDRAILNLGNVTNADTYQDNDNQSMLYIEWDAVMIKNNDTNNGSTYWVSAGAEFNNEDEIWVGQASFETVIDTFVPSESPTFNFTGPSEVEIGSSAVFRVDMYLPYDSIDLVFDAFSPLNATGVMSICSVVVVDTATNYECFVKEKPQHVLYPSDGPRGNARGRLPIGTVTNKGVREFSNPADENRFSVEFVAYLYDDLQYIGENYWVGAAVELGADQIWAGQLKLTAINRTTVNMTETPTFSMTTITDTPNVTVGMSVEYELEMKVPENTDGDYELEVLMPYNDSASRFKLCLVNISYQGINVPCVGDKKPVYSSRDNSTIYDRVVWKIGRIIDTAHRTEAFDSKANTITFKIVAQVLNHSLNTAGEKVWITAGMKFDQDRLWVGQNAIILGDVIPEPDNDTSPSFTMTYAFGDEYVPIGGSADVRLEILTKPGIVYYPMEIELIMPFENDTSVYTVCRTEILHVGKNLPCFDQRKLNASVTYSSKTNDSTRNDKAILTLGHVCNIARNASADENDDKIIINVVFKVEEHLTQEDNNTKNWISAGVMFHESKMWVGQLALYASNITVDTYESGVTPYYQIIRKDNDASDDIMQGGTVIFDLILTLPPQSRADWTITVSDNGDTDISVCSVFVKEYGYGIPCLNKTRDGTRTKRLGTFVDEKIVFTLPKLTNVGTDPLVQNGTFDNNTVVVEMAVQILKTATIGLKTVGLKVDYGQGEITEDQNLNVISFVGNNETANTSMPSLDFSIAPMHDNITESLDVGKGQALRFYLDITTTEYSDNNLVVKFLTPVNETGVMEVCNVNIISVGKNMPCLRKETVSGTTSPRINSKYDDIASVDLGKVCHLPIDTVNSDASVIRIEVIAKVTKKNTKVDGDKVWFSSTLRINDDQIYVSQLALTINEGLAYNETAYDASAVNITLNSTDDPFYVRPGLVFSMPVDITVPVNASIPVLVDVDLPVNRSALITVRKMKVTKSGANLACLGNQPDDFEEIYNSTQSTTQNNKGFLVLGVVTNTGHTYRHNVRETDDNSFTVEVEMQFADADVSVDGTNHWISFGVKVGSVLSVMDKMVTVNRTNDEKPDIILTASVNATGVFDQNGMVSIDAILMHTNLSTAEGYNASACFYFPNYMSYKEISYGNFSSQPLTDNMTSPNNGMCFVFDVLYFTDIFAWTFNLTVVSWSTSQGQQPATTPFEVGCNIIYRDQHMNDSGTFFITRLDSLSYQVLPPSDIGCSPAVLGMESGSIQDCQLSASPSTDKPQDARFNVGSGWHAATRRGNFTRYLQVNFGNVTKVTKVTFQPPTVTTNVNEVRRYVVVYSDDGINWQEGETVDVADYTTTAVTTLQAPVESRFLRLMFLQDDFVGTDIQDGTLGVRVELDGCVSSADIPLEELCQRNRRAWDDPNSNVSAEFQTRGFLAAPNDIYFCDANPYKHNKMECFYSSDGLGWTALDESIINVIGELDGDIFGISWDKRAFMQSSDRGSTWMAISYAQFAKAKVATDFKSALEVPWLKDASAGAALYPELVTPHANYQKIGLAGSKTFGAYYGGLYDVTNSKKVVDWTRCCQ